MAREWMLDITFFFIAEGVITLIGIGIFLFGCIKEIFNLVYVLLSDEDSRKRHRSCEKESIWTLCSFYADE